MKTLLLAGSEWQSTAGELPPLLTPVGGGNVLERVSREVLQESADQLFVLCASPLVEKWNLDHAASQIDPRCTIVPVQRPTRGAACTALLAIDLIAEDDELLVLAGDEYLDSSYLDLIREMRLRGDAGVVTFPSWHPRFSFVEISDGCVTRCAEKDPISGTATAGFYWFSRAKLFVTAACTMIQKRDEVNGAFYICPVFNQLILEGVKVGAVGIREDQYIPLKTQVDVISSIARFRFT